VSHTTIERARAAGLSSEAILEVTVECAFATMVGLIDNLAGQVPLDDFLVGRRSGAR
jgi:alkylhydroperoxidase family enzyme